MTAAKTQRIHIRCIQLFIYNIQQLTIFLNNI